MRKIVILGSKPGVILPAKADHVYATNASSYYYSEQLKHYSKVTTVTSAVELYEKNLVKSPRWEKIIESVNGDLIITATDKRAGALQKLQSDKRFEKLIAFTAIERQRLFDKVLGPPWIIPIKLPIRNIRSADKAYFIDYFLNLIKKIRHGGDLPSQFRCSTGLFSLVYAINAIGDDGLFILSGIGVNRTENYPDGSPAMVSNKVPHVIPDLHALIILNKKFKIFTTDRDLSDACGLKMWR